MQVQILIAILSFLLGITEGLNVYKGPLFSLYLRKFNRKIESYTLPFFMIIFILWTIIFAKFSITSVLMVGIFIVLTYLMKLLIWKYHHYTGSFSPSLMTAIKWVLINSLINMEFILPLFLVLMNVLYYFIYIIANFSPKIVLSISNEDVLRGFAMLNMEIINIILGIVLGLILILMK
ncbi:hypothetical protein [Acidianus brierleyi]|uniref:Uncharacterized protein n=1 Tax=Acidianus brierleyi TaxID=41673 RepID=A0A2U9IHW8_9CREN|nr:hypothetical protein [Acidianus brierleyi]AWR95585.1 hypothetical protein DFR85_14295 [Acidianus brierleyi]